MECVTKEQMESSKQRIHHRHHKHNILDGLGTINNFKDLK